MTPSQEQPLVSIIVRTEGKRGILLQEAVDSIVRQDYKNFEIIIVEDGYPGAADPVAIQARRQGAQIRIVSIPKRGRSAAGNAGLTAARGELIGFLDDDDILEPFHISALSTALCQSAHADIAYASALEVAFATELEISWRDAGRHRRLTRVPEITATTLVSGNSIPIQAVMFRRRLYERLGGFDENLDALEDWELWLKYASTSAFLRVDRATSMYRVPSDREANRKRADAHRPVFESIRRSMMLRAQIDTPQTEMPATNPEVSVIVVNFNAGTYLQRCLSDLSRQTFSRFEALVVDNRSSDASFDKACRTLEHDARFRFFQMNHNYGFATANNLAAALSNAPWIATLNPDAFPEPTWLEELMSGAKENADCEIFGSLQVNADDPSRLDGNGDRYLFCGFPWRDGAGGPRPESDATHEAFSACAAAALYKRERFKMLGGFDERFFCYLEDVDLGFRHRLMGGKSLILPRAVVRHVGGVTSGGPGSYFARFHGTRNAIWTFVKNMPGPLFLLLAPTHCAALICVFIRHTFLGNGEAWRHACVSAIRLMAPIRGARKAIQGRRTASAFAIARAMSWNLKRYRRSRFQRSSHGGRSDRAMRPTA